MLMPKRVKFRRVQRGRLTGKALRGNTISNGEFGLVATEPAWITANQIDAVIIDELPAQFIVKNNENFKCVPLYYAGETDAEDAPVVEEYAICVTKGNKELLDAINAVLADLMKKDESGKTEVEKMVMKHMGFED